MEKKPSLVILLVFSILANFTIAENYKIAFGSCLDQENPQPIWNSIYKEDIDSFVFLGDNVYDYEFCLCNKWTLHWQFYGINSNG